MTAPTVPATPVPDPNLRHVAQGAWTLYDFANTIFSPAPPRNPVRFNELRGRRRSRRPGARRKGRCRAAESPRPGHGSSAPGAATPPGALTGRLAPGPRTARAEPADRQAGRAPESQYIHTATRSPISTTTTVMTPTKIQAPRPFGRSGTPGTPGAGSRPAPRSRAPLTGSPDGPTRAGGPRHGITRWTGLPTICVFQVVRSEAVSPGDPWFPIE